MAKLSQLGCLYLEKLLDIQGFANFTAAHFVVKRHVVNSWQKIPSLLLVIEKLTENCVCFTNPCINLLVLPYLRSVVNVMPRCFNFLTCCSALPLVTYTDLVSGETNDVGLFSVNFLS